MIPKARSRVVQMPPAPPAVGGISASGMNSFLNPALRSTPSVAPPEYMSMTAPQVVQSPVPSVIAADHLPATVPMPPPAPNGVGGSRWMPPPMSPVQPRNTYAVAADNGAGLPKDPPPDQAAPAQASAQPGPARATGHRRRPAAASAQQPTAASQAQADVQNPADDPNEIAYGQGKRLADATATGHQMVADANQLAAQDAQNAEAARAERMAQDEAAIGRRIDEVDSMRVDPNQWFSSRGTVGSIGAALAVGLGAAAQSLTGSGPNNAMNIINAAIERDMQSQTQNISNARAGVNNRENALGRLRQEFGDQRAAEEAFRMRSLGVAEQQAAALVARASNPTARERAAEVQQGIQAQMAASRQALQDRLTLQNNESRNNLAEFSARHRGGGGGAAGSRPLRPLPPAQAARLGELNGTIENADRAMRGVESMMREVDAGGSISGTGVFDSTIAGLGRGQDDGAIAQGVGAAARAVLGETGVADVGWDARKTEMEAIVGDMINRLSGATVNASEAQRMIDRVPPIGRVSSEADYRRALSAVNAWIASSTRVLRAERDALAAAGGPAPTPTPGRGR